jgi:kinetochore protein Mis13/DSN1
VFPSCVAAAVYDEQDGDFHFTRGTKRVKTAQDDTESAVVPALTAAKKTGRGRQAKDRASQSAAAAGATAPATSKKPSRRKSSPDSSPEVDRPLIVAKRTTRRSTRTSTEKSEKERQAGGDDSRDNGDMDLAGGMPMDVDKKAEAPDSAVESAQIALPISDTPIINRNKEMRKKGTGNRRSSLGMRGRRASSLIENGHNAIPHREVETSEFYKHIEAEGLVEPRRMKQLLTWCGERALSEKPPHGSSNSNAILGGERFWPCEGETAGGADDLLVARAIQDQLLKDFACRSEFSDWFSREDAPERSVVTKPNPRNMEHEQKIAQLEQKIQKCVLTQAEL